DLALSPPRGYGPEVPDNTEAGRRGPLRRPLAKPVRPRGRRWTRPLGVPPPQPNPREWALLESEYMRTYRSTWKSGAVPLGLAGVVAAAGACGGTDTDDASANPTTASQTSSGEGAAGGAGGQGGAGGSGGSGGSAAGGSGGTGGGGAQCLNASVYAELLKVV